jgi:hypothetical protein
MRTRLWRAGSHLVPALKTRRKEEGRGGNLPGFSTIPFAETHIDLPFLTNLMQISAYDDVNAVLLSPKFVQGGFQLAGRSWCRTRS